MPVLDWIGKKAVVKHHNEVPFHLLQSMPELNFGDSSAGNLVVQGDNLLVLKALLPYYAQQVKCIYIDPPYNTGKENWVYNDNVNSPEIKEWLGRVVGDEATDLSRHDKWLCMMYPRLRLLRDFLREDGVIMISIDDFEVFHLRVLLNEIFGPQNFIAQLVWDKTRKNDAKLFSVGHEYILVYAKSLSTLRKLSTVWREQKPGAADIVAKWKELRTIHSEDFAAMEAALSEWYRELPRTHPAKKLSRYKHIDHWGPRRDRDISWPGGGGPRYDVLHPVTGEVCLVPEAGWRFATIETMQDQIAKGLVVFRDDHTEPPFRKAHLLPIPEETDVPESEEQDELDEESEELAGLQVMPSVIFKQAQVAVKTLRNIFDGRKVFQNPKDHEVIMRLIRYCTGPDDIVLDAFAGSGTTGHAVMALNRLEQGKRRCLLIEMDDNIFRNVTHERLRKVSEGYSYTKSRGGREEVAGLASGFAAAKLGDTLFSSNGKIRDSVTFQDLARHVFFAETGCPWPGQETPGAFLGAANDVAVYLLYNGILRDVDPENGNVLTTALLAKLPRHDGAKTIYGTACLISEDRLRQQGITFRQIPYKVRVN